VGVSPSSPTLETSSPPLAAPPVASGGEGAPIRPRNEALAARFALLGGAPGTAGAPPPDHVAAVAPVETAKLAAMLRPYVADGLIAAERWVIDWRGFVANDPDAEQRKDLHECVEVLLVQYLPAVSVGPWGKLCLSMTLLYASMRIGAERKPPPLAPTPPGAAAGTAAPAQPLRSIPLSSPASGKSTISDAGDAGNVVPIV
jgi:hypothetical protein